MIRGDFMNISNREDLRKTLAEHYLKLTDYTADDINLINEALALIEQIFKTKSDDEILHHSGDLAVPYLALLAAKDNIDEKSPSA